MSFSVGQGLRRNKYLVTRELGHGRFSTTYLVQDRDGNRWVIKTLKSDLLSSLSPPERDRLEELFCQESVKLARCRHPNIVSARDPFKEGNQWCIPMEYIDGSNLAERAQRLLPVTEALNYIRQIGEALVIVHSNGFAHRDVRPGNIMVRVRNGQPEAVLIDFGLALDFDHTLTSTGWREFPYHLLLLQNLSLICPLKGFSHRAVEIIDEFKNACFQLGFAIEISPSE